MAQSSCRFYCSVPRCSNNKQKHPYLSFHDFPKEPHTRALWVKAIRNEEGPAFKVLRGSTHVCSRHFNRRDIYITAKGRTRIRRGSVPSKFAWNDWGKRAGEEEAAGEGGSEEKQAADGDGTHLEEERLTAGPAAPEDHNYSFPHLAASRIQELEHRVRTLETDIRQLTVLTHQPGMKRFCASDEDFRFFTRFPSEEVFIMFWEFIRPSASRLACWSEAQRMTKGPPSAHQKLPLIDEFFLFLCRVAAGLKEEALASIFRISLATVRRIILTWTRYLYQVLGSQPTWISRKQVQATMPEKVQMYCPYMRVIIDCAEIRCEKPSFSILETEAFFSHNNHSTFKGVIGIAPCGVITFVSKLYPGCISDKDIIRNSKLTQLLSPGDRVMAAKGFMIEEMLAEVGATLITLPPKKTAQLSMAYAQKYRAMASLRELVERAVRRVKEYHIWDGSAPLSVTGSVNNQLWTICCLLSNFQGPLDVKGDKAV